MANTKDAAVAVPSNIHSDPNFAVICSFLTKYGSLMGLVDVSFEQLEKWIDDTRYVNTTLKELLVRLLKRWKSSANEERLQQYLVKFCHTYSQYDAWEVEGFGFQRCKTETKLRILKNLLECQFDVNAKFKEKINEIPVPELRCQPLGRDVSGKAYWYLMDNDMNIRIYSEEQDDVQNETWQIIVRDRNQLANLISLLEQQKLKQAEKSRSATPSTIDSDFPTAGEGCKLKSTPDLTQSESSSDAVLSSLKVKDEPIDMDKLQLSAGLVAEKAVNGLNELPIIKVKLETSNEASPCITVKKERPDNEENNSDSKCTPDNAAECKASDESMTNSAGETLNLPETNESKNFIAEIKDCSLQSCSVVSGSVEGLKKTPYNGELCISVADQPMTSAADTVNELVPRNICEVQRVSDLNADETKAVCTDREDQLVSNNNSTLIHTEEKIVSQDLQSVSVPKASIKRKRASDERRLSTSSSDDPADVVVGLSESELSESPVLLSGSQSAGEEPPMKRKRDKALKKASERDRLSGRSKTGRSPSKLLISRLQTSDKNVVLRSEDSAGSLPSEQNQSSIAASTKENLCVDAAATKHGQENLEVELNVRSNDVCGPAKEDSACAADETRELVSAAGDNDETMSESSVACQGSSDRTVANSNSEEAKKCSVSGVCAENVRSSVSSDVVVSPLSGESNDLKTAESKQKVSGDVSDTEGEGKTAQEGCKSSSNDEAAGGDDSKLPEVSESDKSNVVANDEVKIVMDCVLDALDDGQKETPDATEADEKCETSELDRSGDTIVADDDASTVAQHTDDVEGAEAGQTDDANTTVVAKKTPQKKTGRRGRKKRGRSSKPPAAKTTDDAKVNGETKKKLVDLAK